jgi:hypothetical protein
VHEQRDHRQRQRPAEPASAAAAHGAWPPQARANCDNPRIASARPLRAPKEAAMNESLKILLVVAFLIVILWNLGAGLYYMLVDKGQSKRTVNALTRRIVLSVALILLVILAIYMGWITPHGVGSNPH